ncbi:hypothetical protein ACFFSA_44225 [Nonomuraea helvata]|uniref:Uncharacterized protein n=2 Tax=Nonomuraea helvata TaxID=37484 RepID=A0ABV5SEW9_9ACTN
MSRARQMTVTRAAMGPFFVKWLQLSQRAHPFEPGATVARNAVGDVDSAVLAAYNAPFPDESYLAAARQFPTDFVAASSMTA